MNANLLHHGRQDLMDLMDFVGEAGERALKLIDFR
jgi:hypothetical protein